VIPIIDIFAGPGGLAEGFGSIPTDQGSRLFDVNFSVECDANAHQTLLLRSFYRQFPLGNVPDEYYQFYRQEISIEELYESYPEEAERAERIALLGELGKEKICPQAIVDERIEEAVGEHEHWVLIGGPPCQAYSTAGRSRNKGKPNYVPEDDPKNYLYKEYLRILGRHQPSVFVMENVKGMLSVKLNGELVFHKVLRDLAEPSQALRREGIQVDDASYSLFSLTMGPQNLDDSPRNFVIHSERYGIPQARHRVIILGIRNDIPTHNFAVLQTQPVTPVDSVLVGLPELRSGLSKEPDGEQAWNAAIGSILTSEWFEAFQQEQPEFAHAVEGHVQNAIEANLTRGGEFVECLPFANWMPGWLTDHNLGGIRHHATRGHMSSDLHRYLFVSAHANMNGNSPRLETFPEGLLPAHQNALTGAFNDRFRAQHWGQPAKTITSHISQDGHYYIHPDPNQCRSLTVREAARIQTFPDNYIFCGGRTSQFHQVGNAVPPYLAAQIASCVAGILEPLINP